MLLCLRLHWWIQLMKKPTLGWRTSAKLMKEFRQGETQSRWSERRFLILMAEYRMNCRHELLVEIEEAGGHKHWIYQQGVK